jgi:hypothetical protein
MERTHARQESDFDMLANPLFEAAKCFSADCCIPDSPPLPRPRLNRIGNCCWAGDHIDRDMAVIQSRIVKGVATGAFTTSILVVEVIRRMRMLTTGPIRG